MLRPLESIRELIRGEQVRVPVAQADSDLECAAACLVMVLGYHGREVPIAEAHDRCGVGRDGATALDLTNAARSYGLRVHPLSLELDELEDLPCPAILHWGFSHFVVLEELDARGATIVRPGGGRRAVRPRRARPPVHRRRAEHEPRRGLRPPSPTTTEEPAWQLVARRAFRAPRAGGRRPGPQSPRCPPALGAQRPAADEDRHRHDPPAADRRRHDDPRGGDRRHRPHAARAELRARAHACEPAGQARRRAHDRLLRARARPAVPLLPGALDGRPVAPAVEQRPDPQRPLQPDAGAPCSTAPS